MNESGLLKYKIDTLMRVFYVCVMFIVLNHKLCQTTHIKFRELFKFGLRGQNKDSLPEETLFLGVTILESYFLSE